MDNKTLYTLRAYRRWLSGRGAKYMSCLPPSISTDDIKQALVEACNAIRLRLPVGEFTSLTKGAETALMRFKKNRKDITHSMNEAEAEEFEKFFIELSSAVKKANRIVRSCRKAGLK